MALVFILAIGYISAGYPLSNLDPKITNTWPTNLKDVGKAINCGDAKHNFTLMWTPRKLKYGKHVTFFFDVVAAEELSVGSMEFVLKIQDTIIMKKPATYDCRNMKHSTMESIEKYFPAFKFPCPFHKGEHFKVKGADIVFKPPIPLPAGVYTVEIRITTSTGRDFMCAQLNLELAEVDYNDY